MSLEKKVGLMRNLLRPNQDTRKKIKPFLLKLGRALKNTGAEVMLGGSVAKDTYLPDKYDADVFVRFPQQYKDKDISAELKKALDKLKLKHEVLHGSRDYFRVENNVLYEVVPVLKVSGPEDVSNIADMSPLHVEYFNKKASNAIRDDVRVLKAFLKAHGLYGAESYIKGFSGHVVDLLILYYGSFTELLKKAVYWKEKKVIDIENHYSRQEALMFLNESKIQGPLIVIDPVQKTRNAAAALSLEAFTSFKALAKAFLKSPSEEFFTAKSIEEKILAAKKRHGAAKHFLVKIKPLKTKQDVAGAKILKIKEFLEESLEKNGFKVLGVEWGFQTDKAEVFLSVHTKTLPEKQLIQGPPVGMKGHVAAFRKKHKKIFVKKGNVYAEVKRKHKTPKPLLKELLRKEYVGEKCENISLQNT